MAVMTMGGVEDTGQLNLLFEGKTDNGKDILISATFPSERHVPMVDGRVPIFGAAYIVVFSGSCERLADMTVCNAETLTLSR